MQAWMTKSYPKQVGIGARWLTADKILAAMKSGQIGKTTLDDRVSRILRVVFLSGIFDHPHTEGGKVDSAAQQAIARQGATEGIVLLKNVSGLLPLDPSKIHSIAVIGPNAAVARLGGGDAGLVHPR